jgi:hypothetical protein
MSGWPLNSYGETLFETDGLSVEAFTNRAEPIVGRDDPLLPLVSAEKTLVSRLEPELALSFVRRCDCLRSSNCKSPEVEQARRVLLASPNEKIP